MSPCPVWSRRWPGLGRVLSAELSWLLIDQVASDRRSLRTAPQRSGVVAAAGNARTSAMPSVAVRVHHPVSTHSAPTSGVWSSSRPVSGHRAPASGVRPSGVRSFGVRRPPGHIPLVRVSPTVVLGITSVRRATFTAGTDRVARGLRCPERLGRRPELAWGGDAVEVVVGRWGAAVADLGGSSSGAGCDRARPLTGQEEASPTCGRPSLPAEPEHGSAGPSAFLHLGVAGIFAWNTTTLGGRCRA